MADQPTGSHRPRLKFWGWGRETDALTDDENALIDQTLGMLAPGGLVETPPPSESDFDLPRPRLTPPSALAGFCSSSTYDRLTHTYGKSYADIARMLLRQVPAAPDLVAFPRQERDVADILAFAEEANAAVIPFGAGSSVCGGVEPAVGSGYAGTISLDLQYLNQVLELDETSRAARIQAGILGPELESALRPHGLTLRHFPQSFEFSTLGGWIATRSGGHYASLYTHIDDFVESTRTLTPRGPIETRRLPGSGAGPSPDRLMIGSEGILGVITEAWMRLQHRPRWRGTASVRFNDVDSAAEAVRALSQSGLFPTNCRLLDADEVRLNRVGDGRSPQVILGFESADHPVDAWMHRALELAGDHGGAYDAEAVQRSLSGEAEGSQRKGAAGAWRNAFIRMPYWRDRMIAAGVIMDTFETAVTWDRFPSFYATVKREMAEAIQRITGRHALVSCRFTHVYPDGPAPYFSYVVLGSDRGDIASALDQWRAIKQVSNDLVVREGGTITHHHAVGRDHRSGYDIQAPELFRHSLAAVKRSLDPRGLLNPGVLVDPQAP
ncbi:FAD-binding oxidoreductase [Ectothiorhodospiraceae bacterium WFHF3C12]|nr:FAD-binding oxidoreductase [Ectothiorhodospiraceae bacterium WFHF3C12]